MTTAQLHTVQLLENTLAFEAKQTDAKGMKEFTDALAEAIKPFAKAAGKKGKKDE